MIGTATIADEKKYPHPDDDDNRFAWGPGQVKYQDVDTGEWKWLGGPPDPEKVEAVQHERERAQKKIDDARRPKIKLHHSCRR